MRIKLKEREQAIHIIFGEGMSIRSGEVWCECGPIPRKLETAVQRRLSACRIVEEDENVPRDQQKLLGEGRAECSPQDRYSRKRGRCIALDRATASFTKAERRQIFDAYLRRNLGPLAAH
jgi:hypothetical protein